MSSIMLSPRTMQDYSKLFLNGGGRLESKYSRAASAEDRARFRDLGGDPELTDTPLEIALLSAATGVVNIRPVEAVQMLGDEKRTDLTLGAEVLRQITVLRFLNNAAVGRYEGILKSIIDRGNVTRAEIENCYRQNIGKLVAEAVDESIPKSSIGAPTATALTEIKNAITQFFLNPTTDNFVAMYQRNRQYANTDGNRGRAASIVFIEAVYSLGNVVLGDALISGTLPSIATVGMN